MRLPLLKWSNLKIYLLPQLHNAEVPLRVTPKKVAAGKRLAQYNCRKKEELAQVAKAQPDEAQESESNLSYDAGAVIAVEVLGLHGYYIYESKKGDNNDIKVTLVGSVETQKRANNADDETRTRNPSVISRVL